MDGQWLLRGQVGYRGRNACGIVSVVLISSGRGGGLSPGRWIAGGHWIGISVSHRRSQDGLSVRDRGDGFPKVLEHLFRKEIQVRRPFQSVTPGAGITL